MWVGGQRHAPVALPSGNDPVPIVQEAGWAPVPVWTGAENLAPTGIRSPHPPARSESLYRLSYPGPHSVHSRTVFFPTQQVMKDVPLRPNANIIVQKKERRLNTEIAERVAVHQSGRRRAVGTTSIKSISRRRNQISYRMFTR